MIGNDNSRWLPAVDPTQRETILSIGAFLQNLEYAAANLGDTLQFSVLANTNQDEQFVDVQLTKSSDSKSYPIEALMQYWRSQVPANYEIPPSSN